MSIPGPKISCGRLNVERQGHKFRSHPDEKQACTVWLAGSSKLESPAASARERKCPATVPTASYLKCFSFVLDIKGNQKEPGKAR